MVIAGWTKKMFIIGAVLDGLVTWVFRVGRCSTSPTTGGGFTVAASALTLRAICELVLALVWSSATEPAPESAALTAAWVATARNVGLVGFIWGLGLVAAALVSERRMDGSKAAGAALAASSPRPVRGNWKQGFRYGLGLLGGGIVFVVAGRLVAAEFPAFGSLGLIGGMVGGFGMLLVLFSCAAATRERLSPSRCAQRHDRARDVRDE